MGVDFQNHISVLCPGGMAANWTEIALVDYTFKLIISLGLFVPVYGVLLNYFIKRLTTINPKLETQKGLI